MSSPFLSNKQNVKLFPEYPILSKMTDSVQNVQLCPQRPIPYKMSNYVQYNSVQKIKCQNCQRVYIKTFNLVFYVVHSVLRKAIFKHVCSINVPFGKKKLNFFEKKNFLCPLSNNKKKFTQRKTFFLGRFPPSSLNT